MEAREKFKTTSTAAAAAAGSSLGLYFAPEKRRFPRGTQGFPQNPRNREKMLRSHFDLCVECWRKRRYPKKGPKTCQRRRKDDGVVVVVVLLVQHNHNNHNSY